MHSHTALLPDADREQIAFIGVTAEIANAIYLATGKRVRDLPIMLDGLRRHVFAKDDITF